MKLSRQRVLVIVLSCLALGLFMPAATQGWQTHGSYGLRILRAEGFIREVERDSPAGKAGIVPGDSVNIGALGIDGHLRLMNPRPGDDLTATIVHQGSPRTVTLVAQDVETPEVLRWLILGEFLTVAAFIFVGTMLVFLRAAPMTWWLWTYCIGIAPINALLDYYAFLPNHVFTGAWLVGRTLFGGFSVFPLLPFVLRFPEDRIGGWRARIRFPIIALVGCAFIYYIALAWIGLRWGLDNYSTLNAVPALLMYALAATVLIATYLRAHGVARQRLKWAVAGMVCAFGAQILEYVPGPSLQAPIGELASIVMPVTVAYAALRHRLIDIEFVANRAIVYGVLTALLIALVGVLHWFTSRFILENHFALYIDAAATIGIGFVLNPLHEYLESLTDRFFFRSRHIAEQQLARVARSLSFSNHISSLEEALVDEPARWLQLASAAFFCRNEERGAFVRGRSIGWDSGDLAEFPDDAPIARYLLADRAALTARSAAWQVDGLPAGAAAPALYVPIFSRHTLHAVAVYGAHVNSTLPDPVETELLTALAPEAGLALDHLAYEALAVQLAEARAKLA